MPRLRPRDCGVHADGDCQCYKHPAAAVQSLEELDYLKSACAAAQQGNLAKLSSILDKHPHAVNSDGAEGEQAAPSVSTGSKLMQPNLQVAAAIPRYTTLHEAGMSKQPSCCCRKARLIVRTSTLSSQRIGAKLILQVQILTREPELVEPQPCTEHVIWDTTKLQSCCKLSGV